MDPLSWVIDQWNPLVPVWPVWEDGESGWIWCIVRTVVGLAIPRLNPVALVVNVALFLGLVLLGYSILRRKQQQRAYGTEIRPGKYRRAFGEKADFHDVVVVGAGPCGSTASFFMARSGLDVVMLEKRKFPRYKPCGDAVCKIAIEILEEMGLYPQLVKENLARVADEGGLVSPGGVSFIGSSHEALGTIPAALAIKRIHLDEKMAKRAAEVGAQLIEEQEVTDAKFDDATGLWSVYVGGSSTPSYRSRVLLIADGAQSNLGRSLGLVQGEPQGVCSTQFIKGGRHNFNTDGVVFYHKDFLPGYAAVFTHCDYDNATADPKNCDLNLAVYVIPGNPAVPNSVLKKWHDWFLLEDPNSAKAIGPIDADADTDRPMQSGPLRLGGIPKPYGKHLLISGDAAGFIDPLTGEGIHHAMESGKLAAEFLRVCFMRGNFDEDVMAIFHHRTVYHFAYDFAFSMWMCQLCYRFPILLDAGVLAVRRGGNQTLARWADIMTGRVPKIALLGPRFSLPIAYELAVLLFKRITNKQTPLSTSTSTQPAPSSSSTSKPKAH